MKLPTQNIKMLINFMTYNPKKINIYIENHNLWLHNWHKCVNGILSDALNNFHHIDFHCGETFFNVVTTSNAIWNPSINLPMLQNMRYEMKGAATKKDRKVKKNCIQKHYFVIKNCAWCNVSAVDSFFHRPLTVSVCGFFYLFYANRTTKFSHWTQPHFMFCRIY